MKDKVTLLVLLAALLCGGMIAGMHYLNGRLVELQEQNNDLEQRIVNAQAETNTLIEQKRVFTEVLSKLDDDSYHVKPARDSMEFYAALQEAARINRIQILSTRQQGVNKDGISTMTLNLQGEYYDMLQLLAAWRALPMTVRVANLTLRRAGPGQSDFGRVVAETTVETISSENVAASGTGRG